MIDVSKEWEEERTGEGESERMSTSRVQDEEEGEEKSQNKKLT